MRTFVSIIFFALLASVKPALFGGVTPRTGPQQCSYTFLVPQELDADCPGQEVSQALAELHETTDSLDTQVTSLLAQNTALFNQNTALVVQNTALQTQVRELVQDLVGLRKKVQDLETSVEQNSGRTVVFSVARSSGLGPARDPTIITYDHVFTNIGNGYQTNTSMFRAPIKGIYWFSYSARGQNQEVVALIHNGANVVRAVTGNAGNGAQSVALILNKGDLVHTLMHVYHEKRIYSSEFRYITFSGYLMQVIH